MKLKYLCDGGLDSHGMDPGNGGIPSVLQAGSCKSQMTWMSVCPLVRPDWCNHSGGERKRKPKVLQKQPPQKM